MGKLQFATNLAKKTQQYLKLCEKSSILQTKPITNISLKGLKYTPNIGADVCQFKNVDRSLCPKLLEELRSVTGTPKEKITTIKDKMLKAMGYSEPELLVIEDFPFSDNICVAGINYFKGKFYVSPRCIDGFSNENLIAITRHELDHVDKFAKMVKVFGIEKVEQMLPYTIDNKDFWLKISKDANIEGFDANKYLNALKEYGPLMPCNSEHVVVHVINVNKYCTNPIEESAYCVQKKIEVFFGIKEPTLYDMYGPSITKINNKLVELQKTNPNEFNGLGNFEQLYAFGLLLFDKSGITAIKTQNIKMVNEIIQNELKNLQHRIKLHNDIYEWLEKGIYTGKDLLKYLGHS